MKWICFIILLMFCVGCDTAANEESRVKNKAYYQIRADLDEQAARLCLEKGGIPQRSNWDGKVYDCKLIK